MNEISFSASNLYGWRMFSTPPHILEPFHTLSQPRMLCGHSSPQENEWDFPRERNSLLSFSPEGNSPTGNGFQCCWLLRKSYQINRASAAARNKSATSHANRWWRHGALIMWLCVVVINDLRVQKTADFCIICVPYCCLNWRDFRGKRFKNILKIWII